MTYVSAPNVETGKVFHLKTVQSPGAIKGGNALSSARSFEPVFL